MLRRFLDEWPAWNRGETAVLGNQTYRKQYDYDATVTFAAAAIYLPAQGISRMNGDRS